MLDRSTAHVFVAAEVEALAHAERERLIAEAQATARDILAEAERAAQEIVARAVKIKAEADRALDDAKRLKVRLCAFRSGLRRLSRSRRVSPRADA
jgi:regulator of protease activity HflC (stomatin/prohibitin superfamily)